MNKNEIYEIYGKKVRVLVDIDSTIINCENCAFDDLCGRPGECICENALGFCNRHFEDITLEDIKLL